MASWPMPENHFESLPWRRTRSIFSSIIRGSSSARWISRSLSSVKPSGRPVRGEIANAPERPELPLPPRTGRRAGIFCVSLEGSPGFGGSAMEG